jgi:hypothetical protein
MIKRYGNHGLVYGQKDTAMLSFEIVSAADKTTIEEERSKYNVFNVYGEYFSFADYTLASYGEDNKLPTEVKNMIKDNHLLPEVLKKQVRFLYGNGPFLYREEVDETGDNIRRIALSKQKYADVWQWLNSWESNGIENSVEQYLKGAAMEYYYTEGIPTKWLYNRSRRLAVRAANVLPVRGLEYVPSTKFRFAKQGHREIGELLERKDFTHAMVGRWDMATRENMEVFPLLDRANPLRHSVAVNYVADLSFGDEIYSIPTFYYGLKEWIRSSNLNPKYINSYLRNSLSAKLHVIIPDSWIVSKQKTLEEICRKNRELDQQGKALITEYEGLKEIGTTFSVAMIQKLIDLKLEELTNVLSGEGDNQGKAFYSRSFRTQYGVEEWQFKEIPVKYKEFIDTLTSLDKHTVKVILEGKGIDPSISNVSGEGLFQSSGSQAYYNYIIYLSQLTFAEDFVCADINRALRINFPRLEREGVKLGLFRRIPERQKELSSDERLDSVQKTS